jgi:peptide chain release factor 2
VPTPFAAGSLNYGTLFDYESKLRRVEEIEGQMSAPGFWDNQERAQATVGELKTLGGIVKPIKDLDRSLADLDTLLEMAAEDPEFAAEAPAELERLEQVLAELELKGLLNGPNDGRNAIVTINARDGGIDANDWAEMLLRMYIQWAKKHDYDVEILDRQDNEEAGISTATIAVRGPMAYGYLRGESGMHRLVRISPFNAEGKRMTSFAAVDVSPEVNDDIEIEIKDEDVRIDKFCSSGAGGQHVNKTASAIRLTHAPSGIVVQCQNERSQHKNLAQAYKMLRARLLKMEEERREAEVNAKYQSQAKTGFGSQIRNYFQHPDQRIKDQRTGYGETHFQSVMDGDIQHFLDAVLRWRAGQPVTQSE